MLNLIDEYTRECLMVRAERRWSSSMVISALADVMVMKGVPEHLRSDNGPEFTGQGSARVAGKNRRKDVVYRTRLSMGERLLRKLQLQAQGRAPERRDLLLDEGNTCAC
jgi:hypothetical protein